MLLLLLNNEKKGYMKMNNNYYQQNTPKLPIQGTSIRNDAGFSSPTSSYSGQAPSFSTPAGNVPPRFLENNFSINIGRDVTIYMSFPDSYQERDKTFFGTIVEVSRDHIVLNDTNTNTWYFLPFVYFDYAMMEERPSLFAQDGSIK